MLANYILKNTEEEPDESGDDDSSISPQRPGRRMVSLLGTRRSTNAKRKPDSDDDSFFEDGESKSSFIKGLNLTVTPTGTPEKEKKILPPSKKKRNRKRQKKASSPLADIEDIDNSDQIDSIISINDPIELMICVDKNCGCKSVHCPFCDPSQIKPSTHARMRDHLEMKHFNHGIQFEDLLIMKCTKTCGEKTVLHYHCPFCKDATFQKRTAAFRHLLTHALRMGKGASAIKLPDLKLPASVHTSGYEVELCKKKCNGKKEPHYHCPKCNAKQEDRKAIICHLWRCQHGNEKNDERTVSTYRPVDINMLNKAYMPKVPASSKVPKEHVSIVRSLADLSHERCELENCCGKKIHCALCYTDRCSPCFPQRMKRHYFCHWQRRVPYKGFWVLPCYLNCQLKEKDSKITQIISHFHCPICGGTRRRREYFYHHLEICQGSDNPFPRSSSSMDLKLEEVDPSVDEELNDSLFDNSEDLGNECEESMEQSDGEVDADNVNSVKVFGHVTAEISRQLLSLAKSQGVDSTIFHDIADETGTKYIVSPGIVSQVHCLQGTLENVTKAMAQIQKELSIEKTDSQEQPEVEKEETASQKEADKGSSQEEDTPKENKSPEQDKEENVEPARRSTRKRPNEKTTPIIPAKRIKQEPVEVEETPRKYSTRGVKVNFARLSMGGGIERTETPKKDDAKTPAKGSSVKGSAKGRKKGKTNEEADEEEEIVILNENNEKFKLKLPSDMVATIKEKMASSQGEKVASVVEVDDLDGDGLEDEAIYEEDEGNTHEFTDAKGQPITSSSIEYYVRKYKMSTSAFIPSVTLNFGTLSRTGNKRAPKRTCKVQNKYRCSKCNFACADFNECTKHLKEVHEAVQKYRCDICERHFEKEAHLQMHLDFKHGPRLEMKEYKCTLCDRVYTSDHAYERHVEKHTNKKFRRFACRHCDFVGEDRVDLETHVKKKHFVDEAICADCGKFFKSSMSLNAHIDNVHKRKNEVACPHCPKIFANPRYLRLHMDVHTGEKKHECQTCGMKFRKKGNLISHEQTHLEKDERTYRYICNDCGQKCNSKSALYQHMNKHTGERPFSCDVCQKTFSFYPAMKKHKVFCHSTENPFECQICDKRFKFQRLLDEHMIVHTGISNHQCDVCKKIFTTASSLKTHKTKCKGLRGLPMTPTKIIVYNPPTITASTTSLLASNQDGQNIENVIKFHLQNQGSETVAENETVIIESGYTTQQVGETYQVTQAQQEIAVDSIAATQVEAEDPAASNDVQVYMCSECNMAFNDYTMAEQHVLQGHEAAAPAEQTEAVVEQKEVTTMMVVDSNGIYQ